MRRRHCRRTVAPAIEALEVRRLLSGAAADPTVAVADVFPARQMERLNRGVVAISKGSGNVYVGWRMLGTDPADIAFNLYRSTNGAAPVKRNATPITATTNFNDTVVVTTSSNAYFVRPVVNGVEQPASESFTLPANTPNQLFLSVPLQIPPAGLTPPSTAFPSGETYTYNANDVSVGDVDGDGAYEYIVKWDPSNSKDNSQSGYTGNVYLDAYKLNGQRLWRIDLGINIRAGAHYTQFMVYDLDGDGRAEVACKTAPGTKDGLGNNVILPGHDPSADYRSTAGYILTGPEYLTVFNGLTGAAMATASYIVPRGSVSSWGDGYGNRVDRFLAGIAYLDGARPSLVMCRGYYTRATLTAWDWRDGKLTQRWLFDSNTAGNGAAAGQGAHSLSVADVDGDGKDEIVYGAATIDDNGAFLGSSGLGHGDALHVSDMDPSRPGVEVYQVHEGTAGNGHIGASLRDGATGARLVELPVVIGSDGKWPDVGRGVAADIDPRPGYEFWSSYHPSIYNVDGTVVAPKSNIHQNFLVWWDDDLYRETLDGTTVSNWNFTTGGRSNIDLDPNTSGTQSAPGVSSINGTKANPNLSADLFGDWREEIIWRTTDNAALRIFTTTLTATSRLFTLMHDSAYRVAIAWQNVAYNQPPHTSFFLGNGMAAPAMLNIYTPAAAITPGVYQAEDQAFGGGAAIESRNAGYNSIGYINFPTTAGFLQFNNVDGGIGGGTTLRFRHALGGASGRAGNLLVNGVAQPITFAPTGSFTTWVEFAVNVTLNPGATNTIRLESTGQDLTNVDQLQVDPPAPSGTVTGVVFHDTDADNLFDAGEPTLANVTVFLDADGDGVLEAGELTTSSNASGAYTFVGVTPGSYTVRAIAPANHVSTNSVPVTTSVGTTNTANLANARTVYDGTAGADHYLVRKNLAGQYEVLVDDVLTYTVFAGIASLAFNMQGGDDTLIVDGVNGVPAPAGGLAFNAGSGAADFLAVRGGVGPDLVSFAASFIALNGRFVLPSAVERLTFDGRGGGDELTVSSGVVALADTQSLAALAVSAPGVLDVGAHDLVVDYSSVSPVGVWTGDAYDGLTGLVKAGRVISSSATAGRTTLGVAETRDALNLAATQTATWSGVAVDATAVLVKFTWGGDANLDGQINVDDYGQIDSNVAKSGSVYGWFAGDFNLDGKINVDDYGIIDGNVSAQDEIL